MMVIEVQGCRLVATIVIEMVVDGAILAVVVAMVTVLIIQGMPQ